MPLIVIGSCVVSILITWFFLKRKYQGLLKETLLEATSELTQQVGQLDTDLKAANQKVADLEYLIKEREKDLAALKSIRDN